MSNEDDLKLFYIHKIGYNSKNEGLYEFMFTTDESNIDVDLWCWDITPACDNALPPEETYVDKTISLKTKSFELFCLHEAVDRPYMHGYHTIHALAYEVEDGYNSNNNNNGFLDYENIFDDDEESDLPLLVFHYGMKLSKIKELFEERKIILKDNEFIETSSIRF